MNRVLLATALVLGITNSASAEIKESHLCKRDGLERTVHLEATSDSGVPCQVIYSKPMEGQPETSLWMAMHDTNYCKQKYDSFIVKLENELEWSCTPTITSKKITQDPEPETVQSVATAPAESAAQAITADNAAPAEINTSPVEITSAEIKSPSVTTASADTQQQQISTQALLDLPEPENNEFQDQQAPSVPPVAAALPSFDFDAGSEEDIGLELIRKLFPTGYYQTSQDLPHTGDVSLCPADGFFIWNTQVPGQPAFEMGPNTSFVFNLAQFSSGLEEVTSRGLRATQCEYNIQSSYCINNQPQGITSLYTSDSAILLNCHSDPVEGIPVRPYALISDFLSDTVPESCAADTPPYSMGMASHPLTPSGTGISGFELALESVDGSGINGANCRYIRGR